MKTWGCTICMLLFLVFGWNVSAQALNFTMTVYDVAGGVVGVDTNVTASWAGYLGPNTMTLASPNPFFGYPWTAHDITTYGPGTYTIDTVEGPTVNFDVGSGQVGGHILFDWGGSTNIDVINVWNVLLPLDPDSPMVFESTDVNGDGIPGMPMVDGPFPGFSASFASSVPEPSSLLLLSTGIMGLLGIFRAKSRQH